jgi:hypothetical protein
MLLAEAPEVDSVAKGERYVVLWAVSYDTDDELLASGEAIHSARDAAKQALELTRDKGSADNLWRVFDHATREWATFAQEDLDSSIGH